VARYNDLNVEVWDNLHLLGHLPDDVFAAIDPTNSTAGSLTPPAGQLWRIVNGASIQWSWAIRRLKFFIADENAPSGCSSTPLPGTAFASGQATALTPPSLALEDSDAMWRSSCLDCAIGAAWIGMVMQTSQEVACVELFQSAEEPFSSATIYLERWGGSSWILAQTFTRVGVGETVLLNQAWVTPAAYQRARVSQRQSSASSSWAVAELGFFASVECTVQVHGTAFSSGSSGANRPGLAFDNNLSSYWQASGGQNEPAWLAMHFQLPSDVSCASLRQMDTTGWSLSLALEIWNGSAWEEKASLEKLYPGGWFSLHWFRSPRQLNVNFQDELSEVPVGYVADTGGPFASRPGGTYGWRCAFATGSNREHFEDLVLDTQVALSCADARWEAEVIAGRYYVRVQYSNPGFGGETASCELEDVSASVGRYGVYESPLKPMIVSVFDGRLTFQGFTDTCSSIAALTLAPPPSRRSVSALSSRWK